MAAAFREPGLQSRPAPLAFAGMAAYAVAWLEARRTGKAPGSGDEVRREGSMEHFAKSLFWRSVAVALVAALAYLDWAISAERTVLPVAEAGGVSSVHGGWIYAASEDGSRLYGYPVGGGGMPAGGWMECWDWGAGMLYRKPFTGLERPMGYPPGTLPPPPGGTPSGRPGER